MTQARGNSLVYLIAAIAATGGLLFGFDTGVISGALLFLKKDFALSPASQGIVVSAVLIGCIIGAALSGKLADKFGRRNIIIGTAVVFGIGSVLCAYAHSIDWLITGRIVIGLAIGVASFAVPLYISEISPARVRGALVSLNQLMITIGIVVSYLVDDLFASVPHGWRFMFLIGIVPSIILGIGMLFLPRSPRWLMRNNNENEARLILQKLTPDEDISKNLQQIKDAISEESGGAWSELAVSWMRPLLLIGIAIMFIQQCTGINTVIYYAPTIFQMAGFTSAIAAISATVGVGVINVIFTIISIKLIDKWGRKPLLSCGLIGMVVSLAVLGLAFKEQSVLGADLKWVAVGSLLLYIASFAISLGPIAWLIIAEIYPLKIRGLAMSLATLSNWLFNFVIALTFLPLIQKLGQLGAFWLYAAIGIGGWFFCKFYVPETKGHTLEEIEEHFISGKHPRELT